jgi:hypothetical protein
LRPSPTWVRASTGLSCGSIAQRFRDPLLRATFTAHPRHNWSPAARDHDELPAKLVVTKDPWRKSARHASLPLMGQSSSLPVLFMKISHIKRTRMVRLMTSDGVRRADSVSLAGSNRVLALSVLKDRR